MVPLSDHSLTMTYSSGLHTDQSLLFRPPLSSPSPSSSAFLDSVPKRKQNYPGVDGNDYDNAQRPSSSVVARLFGSTVLPQHTRTPPAYALAGTLDGEGTAGGTDSSILGDESMYSDSNYRTALGSKRSRISQDDNDASSGTPTSLYYHHLRQDQTAADSSSAKAWGSGALMNAVGGVVGRVWEFCKAGAFKGFYAGGGRGFAMTETGAVVGETDDGVPPTDDYSYGYMHHCNYDDYENRVTGRFPAVELGSPPGVHSAKRRQTSQGDDLGRNWVMVNDAKQQQQEQGYGEDHGKPRPRRPQGTGTAPRNVSGGYPNSYWVPRNRNQTPSVTTSRRISATPSGPRTPIAPSSSRFSSCRPETPTGPPSSQQQQLRPPSSASYASPRCGSPAKSAASLASGGATRPASHQRTASTASMASCQARPYSSYSHQSRRESIGGGGGGGHGRRRSGNVTATTAVTTTPSRGGHYHDGDDDSPRLDAEAKQLAARRKMEEREAHVRISAFNKRLQDMIRQGKEALRTTVEIDDDDEVYGDGWEDA